jgi:hypothetical protein
MAEAFANMVHTMVFICEWNGREQLFKDLTYSIERQLAKGEIPCVQPFHCHAYVIPSELKVKIA